MTTTTPRSPRPARRRLAAALLGAGVLVAAFGGSAASAKEIGSGGGGTTTPTCNPVSSLTVRSDARAGETGLATIDVSYGVKPCDGKQVVTAATKVSEYLNPTVVAYQNPSAPLNGKFTVFGVRVRVTYKVTVSVYDAATGAFVGELSTYTAAIPKGV